MKTNLSIHKDNRNTGKYYHKAPSNSNITVAKAIATSEITAYVHQYDDFGRINYVNIEHIIIKLFSFNDRITIEDLL